MPGLNEEALRVFQLQWEYMWTAKRSPLEQRKQKLRQLRSEILARADDVQSALTADLAKPSGPSYAPEVETMIKVIDEAVDNLEGWAQPRPGRAIARLGGSGADGSARGPGRLFDLRALELALSAAAGTARARTGGREHRDHEAERDGADGSPDEAGSWRTMGR